MATIAFDTSDDFIKNRSTYITWTDLTSGDDGAPLQFAGHADKTLQVLGVFSGGTLVFEGSNDTRVETDSGNAVWFTLNDMQTLPLSKTSAGGDLIVENPRYMRPKVTGGDGSTAITVILACKMVGR